MNNTVELSIILPAYLEEENLRQILPRLWNVAKSLGVRHEILVIDTIKPLDNTREVSAEFGATYVNREGGNYFGDAVRTGIRRAQGEYILFMDADGSHPPEFIRNLFAEIGTNDVVIASRYIEGGSTDNNKTLIFMSLIVNIIYSLVLNLKCKDVSNSFKLYRAPLIRELNLRCNNFDIVEEILFKIKKNHRDVRIKEIPFSFKKRMFGNTKRSLVRFMFSFIGTLVRLRFGR